MINDNLQELMRKVKRGLDMGFSASYVIHKLEKRGYARNQLEHALKLVTSPEEVQEEQQEIQEVEEIVEQPRKEPTTYDEIVKSKREEQASEPKANRFETLKDPESLIIVAIMCFLFFILGMIIDRLFLFLQ